MFVSEVRAGPAAAAGVSDLTGALGRAITDLLDVDPDGVSDGELAVAMVGLRREQSRLAAMVAELTAAFDARRVYATDGSRSAIDWVAVHARLPRPLAAGEVRDARRLRSMPVVRAAWRAGEISPAHVRTLARLAGHPRAGEHFPDGEAMLVDQARRARFDDWERVCAYWRDAADPDGPEQRRARDADLRQFRLGVGLDGVGHPDGYLTPLATATFGGALARLEAELFDADWAAARAVHGDATTAAHLTRSAAQRRHDALVLMAERAVTAPADGKAPAPLVTVMVDYPTLAGRVCELAATGTVVAPGDIAELLGRDDTLIERVVFDGPNRVVDISSARTFRGILRRVLDIVHRRCGHDTCFVPSHRCEGDHILAWTDGGLTSQTNGQLRCGPHNRWRHRHRHDPPPPDPSIQPDDTAVARDLVPDVLAPTRHPHRARGPLAACATPDLVHHDGNDRVIIHLDIAGPDAGEGHDGPNPTH